MSTPLALQILAVLISGQSADVALVPIARTNALSEARAAEVAADIGDVLREAGVRVTPARPTVPQALMVRDPRSAPKEVVAYSGALQDATMSLRIEGGELGDRLVIALELFDSQEGASLATHTLQTQKGGDKSAWRAELKPILDAIFAVTAKRPARPKDAPLVAEQKAESPPEKAAPVAIEAPAAEPRSRADYLVPVGLGVGVLGASAAMLLMSRSRYDALVDPAASPLTDEEARRTALEGQSLQSLSIAGFGVGTAVVAVGLALYLWPESQRDEISLSAGPGELGVAGRF